GQVLLVGQVGVEQQHVAVRGGQGSQVIGRLGRIAVGRLGVGDVDDDGRVAVRVDGEEALYGLLGLAQGSAHGSLTRGPRLEPDGEPELLSAQPSRPVLHLAGPHFDAQGVGGDLADGDEVPAGERTPEGGAYAAAIADQADVEEVADAVRPGALEDEV